MSRNPTLIDCSVSKQCPSPRHDVESFIDFLGIIGAEDGTSSARPRHRRLDDSSDGMNRSVLYGT